MINIQFVDLDKCLCYDYTWLELKLKHIIDSTWLDSLDDLYGYRDLDMQE